MAAKVHRLVQIATQSSKKSLEPFPEIGKRKNLLEEDYKWVEDRNEDVISLLSSSQVEDSFSTVQVKTINGKNYPLVFLTLLVLFNICPVVMDCSLGPNYFECNSLLTTSMSPKHVKIYQVGNILCTLLALTVYWNVYQVQKSPRTFSKWITVNFLNGLFGAALWIVHILLSTSVFGANHANNLIVNVYLISTLVYSFNNQAALKKRIEEPSELNPWKKMIFYLFKNAYYLVMLSITLLYYGLEIGQIIVMEKYPETIAASVIMNYTEILRIIGLITSQCYIGLYYIDINYIYEVVYQLEENLRIADKKLGLSSL